MKINKRKKLTLSSSINVTPFVDVLLILLLVFMVTAPNLNTGFEVDLPNASNASQVGDNNNSVVITISQSELFFNDQVIDVKRLKNSLATFKAGQTQIFIKADAKVAYQRVVTVLNELTLLKFNNISLVAEQ